MELTNEFRVSVPVEDAWNVLTDVERIAPCLPGAQLQEIEGDEFRGVVKVKVGPITAQYKGKATFKSKDDTGHVAVLKAEGRDTRGQGNASAVITATLTPDGDGTVVLVETHLTITGKVAQFGRGVLVDVSGKLLTQFVECLEHDLLSTSAMAAASSSASSSNGAAAVTPPKPAAVTPPKPTPEPAKPAPEPVKPAATAPPKPAATVPPKPAATAPPKPAAKPAPEPVKPAAATPPEPAAVPAQPAAKKVEAPVEKSTPDPVAASAAPPASPTPAGAKSDQPAPAESDQPAPAKAEAPVEKTAPEPIEAAPKETKPEADATVTPPHGDKLQEREPVAVGAATSTPSEPAATVADTATPPHGDQLTEPVEKPTVRKIEHKAAEPVDLLDAAGVPVAKRAVPLVAGVLLILWFLRRRRNRRR